MQTQITFPRTHCLIRVRTVCLNYRKLGFNETVLKPRSEPFPQPTLKDKWPISTVSALIIIIIVIIIIIIFIIIICSCTVFWIKIIYTEITRNFLLIVLSYSIELLLSKSQLRLNIACLFVSFYVFFTFLNLKFALCYASCLFLSSV